MVYTSKASDDLEEEEEEEVIFYPVIPIVEYEEPELIVLYGPKGEVIAGWEDRPFSFGFVGRKTDG